MPTGGRVSASLLSRGRGGGLRGGGGAPKKKSPDFRSSEVGISVYWYLNQKYMNSNSFLTLFHPGYFKTEIIFFDPAGSPTEPRNLKAEKIFNKQNARRFIRLRWDPPMNNGGAEVERYFVSYVPKGLPWKSSTIQETEKTEFNDLKLPSGNIYNARVRAKNKAGMSKASNEVEINLGMLE